MTRSYSDRKRALKWVLLVTVPRTVLDAAASVLTRLGNAAAILEMGPANALRASFAQAGPKEVASAAHSAETSSTTDCVRRARPKEVLRASAAHSSGRISSTDTP